MLASILLGGIVGGGRSGEFDEMGVGAGIGSFTGGKETGWYFFWNFWFFIEAFEGVKVDCVGRGL